MFLVVSFSHFMVLSGILFIVGMVGVAFNRNNIIKTLLCLNIMLLACIVNFVSAAVVHNDITGQIVAIFVVIMAVVQLVIGLAIATVLFRNRNSVKLEETGLMKG